MLSRKQLSFDIQLLSPAYIGCAERRQIDPYMPVRPTAIRGALRAWFRAAAAAVLLPVKQEPIAMTNMIEALRQAERAVFGSTDASSPFVVLPPRGEINIKEERIPDPNQYPGLRYLGYGIFDNLPTLTLKSVEQDSTFDLNLIIRRDRPGLAELLCATVWLWTNVGGIGARCRRGFGSMFLRNVKNSIMPDERLERPDSIPKLIDHLVDGLDWVMNVFESYLGEFLPAPKHAIFYPKATPHPSLRTIDGIRLISVFPFEERHGRIALDVAGRVFRQYRSTLERRKLGLPPLPDYLTVKQSLQGRLPPRAVERAAFGLPLSFYFRSLGGARTTFSLREGGRLPSPLLFRVHALGDPKDNRRVVTLFNLAQGEGARVLLGCSMQQSNEVWNIPTPRADVIDDAITWMLHHSPRTVHVPRGGQ